MSENNDPSPQSAQAAASEFCSWDAVLDAYVAEQVAQRDYEALVRSLILTRAPFDWDVMEVLVTRRRAAHEMFLRTCWLWERTEPRHNGYAHLGPAGEAVEVATTRAEGHSSPITRWVVPEH